MLVRVYLTRKEWPLAAQKCQEIIHSKTYKLWDEYAKNFQFGTENQKEAIFSVKCASNISNGNTMILPLTPCGKVPGLTGNEGDVPTDGLVKAYETGNRRREETIHNSLDVVE